MERETTVPITMRGTIGMKGNRGISRIFFSIDFSMSYSPFENGERTKIGKLEIRYDSPQHFSAWSF